MNYDKDEIENEANWKAVWFDLSLLYNRLLLSDEINGENPDGTELMVFPTGAAFNIMPQVSQNIRGLDKREIVSGRIMLPENRPSIKASMVVTFIGSDNEEYVVPVNEKGVFAFKAPSSTTFTKVALGGTGIRGGDIASYLNDSLDFIRFAPPSEEGNGGPAWNLVGTSSNSQTAVNPDGTHRLIDDGKVGNLYYGRIPLLF